MVRLIPFSVAEKKHNQVITEEVENLVKGEVKRNKIMF